MDVGIAVDNTLPLHIPSFINFIHSHSKAIHCHAIKSGFRFADSEIEYETEIKRLSNSIKQEMNDYDISILATAIPFENNYFYEGSGGRYIISLSDWNQLTTLPMANGIAYMLCQIITKYHMHIGENHEEKTGCINDFWWDKTGIDIGMRAAFICDQCKSKSADNPSLASQEFTEITSILNAISTISRRGGDILFESTLSPSGATAVPAATATFLCHNSADKPKVRVLNETLKNGGIRTWLDEEQIAPGEIWQDKLEKAISSIASCLVISGDSGMGPWQDNERRAFINEFSNRGAKIIPVLIGNPVRPPELPLFLKQFMWADLRSDDGRQVAKLISALRSG